MARKTVDSCMFCGPEPCALHQPKVKAVKRAPKPAIKTEEPPVAPTALPAPAIVAPAPQQHALAAMQRHAARPAAAPKQSEPVSDTVWEDAIRALAPILDPVERSRFRSIISQPSSTASRAAAWRSRVRSS